MNTIEQQGDEMVEMFMPFAYYNPESANILKEQVSNATRIAIAHCKRVIEVLGKFKSSVFPESYIEQEIRYQKSILSELEGRVK